MTAAKPDLRLVFGDDQDSIDHKGLKEKVHLLWEVERRQASLWLPVFFAVGIGSYFALPMEPPGVVVAAGLVLVMALCWAANDKPWVRAMLLLMLVMAAGMASAKWRAARVATPVIGAEYGPAGLSGRLVIWDRSSAGAERILVDVAAIDGMTPSRTPRRVRLTVRTGMPAELRVGQPIALRAVLLPPPGPAMPGAFDFGRQAYFQGIGAVGFAVTPVVLRDGPLAGGWRARIDRLRGAIAARISAAIDGQPGAIARALLVGDKSQLSEASKTAFRDAGLAHLLAISGLHLALVAGGLFFALRAGLALIPSLALHWPLKSICAIAGLAGGFVYLLISGMTLPTQRAFMMAAVVFIAVLAGRRAISLRSAALAAWLVLLLQPEALVSVSFQMSFAAVIGLVAAYEAWRQHRSRQHGQAHAQDYGWAAKIRAYFLAVVFSTLVAEIAINPLSAYHFNQLALYGVAGNLVAIPLTSMAIMPAGVIGLLLMPLGLEAWPLWLMGEAIAIVLAAAHAVSSAPGAVLVPPTPPLASLLLFGFGGLWLCLWRSRMRLLGIVIAAMAAIPALSHDRPDLLVADSGRPVALRDPDSGALLLSTGGGQGFVRDSWLRQNGQTLAHRWQDDAVWTNRHRAICDDWGCALDVPRGGQQQPWRLAIAQHPAALAEDCRLADILITPLPAPPGCAPSRLLIDAGTLTSGGAHAVYFLPDGGLRVESASQSRGRRPWVPATGSQE